MLSPAFIRKVERLDADGLKNLLSQLIGAEERSRVRFARSRSVRDGERQARLRHEIAETRMRLRALPPEVSTNDG